MGGAQSRRDSTPAGSPSNAISPEETLFIPKGLYQRCNWEPKTLKRLILAKKLSAFYPGKEENDPNEQLEECPICFLFYPGGLNRSLCCKKGVCTECFLQIKKPNIRAICPFCNTSPYAVIFSGPLSKEEKQKEEQEQQKVLELKIKMRVEEQEQDKIREEKRRLSISVNSTTSTSPSQQESSDKFPGPQSLPTHITNIRNNASIDSPIPHREYSTSYPPSNSNNNSTSNSTNSSTSSQTLKSPYKDSTSNKDEVDLEELMLMEAIRLSLMSSPQPSDKTTPVQVHDVPILNINSPSDGKLPSSGHQSFNSMESQNEIIENEYENHSESSEDFELALALSMSLQGERR